MYLSSDILLNLQRGVPKRDDFYETRKYDSILISFTDTFLATTMFPIQTARKIHCNIQCECLLSFRLQTVSTSLHLCKPLSNFT